MFGDWVIYGHTGAIPCAKTGFFRPPPLLFQIQIQNILAFITDYQCVTSKPIQDLRNGISLGFTLLQSRYDCVFKF
jgi:hypothetical protein